MDVVIPKGLAKKFMPPANGRYEVMKNRFGQNLSIVRYEAENADADIIVQTGLNEPKEKNSELYSDLAARNYSVHSMDWPYQGFSDGSPNHRRRHTNGVRNDIQDFHAFVKHVKDTRKSKDAPLLLMGHSYGGHIVSRYLAEDFNEADAAFITAPMIEFNFWPDSKIGALSPAAHGLYAWAKTLSLIHGDDAYAPGCADWTIDDRDNTGDIFSNDPERKMLSNAWIGANPKTQVGRTTLKWVMDSVDACRDLHKMDLSHIITPLTVALAGGEVISNNKAAYDMASRIPSASVLEFPNAKHEMWMCDDYTRNGMLSHIDGMIAQLKLKR
jgi:lysophospholipase